MISIHDEVDSTRQSMIPEYKLKAVKSILAIREKELLELKGPCSTCRLHFAHSGPCA